MLVFTLGKGLLALKQLPVTPGGLLDAGINRVERGLFIIPDRLQREDTIFLAGIFVEFAQHRKGGFCVVLFLIGVLAQPDGYLLQTGVVGAGIVKADQSRDPGIQPARDRPGVVLWHAVVPLPQVHEQRIIAV